MIAEDAVNDLKFFLLAHFPGLEIEVRPGFDETGQLTCLEVAPAGLVTEVYAREVLGPQVEAKVLPPIAIYCGEKLISSHIPQTVDS